MSNKKQTAVGWLIEQIKEADKNGYSIQLSKLNEWHQQAKEMEKEQMKESFFVGDDAIFHGVSETDFKSFEQYYIQTYGK